MTSFEIYFIGFLMIITTVAIVLGILCNQKYK